MPDSAPVIPDFDVVIPTPGVVIPAPGVVIPDSIRDPAPRRHWIAGQARNDKAWSAMTKRGAQ
jgi:hypothetical protein